MQLDLDGLPKSGLIWLKPAIGYFVAAADRMDRHSLGTAVICNQWPGQREGDIIALPRAFYRQGRILFVQSKTGARVDLPVEMVAALTARLEAEFAKQEKRKLAGTTLLLCEAAGQAWKEDHLRHEIARVRAQAVLDMEKQGDAWFPAEWHPEGRVAMAALKFMHLRHTAVTRMAEAGVDALGKSAVTDHIPQSIDTIIERYQVRTTKLAALAFQKRLESEPK